MKAAIAKAEEAALAEKRKVELRKQFEAKQLEQCGRNLEPREPGTWNLEGRPAGRPAGRRPGKIGQEKSGKGYLAN